jgi:hypothetical protein
MSCHAQVMIIGIQRSGPPPGRIRTSK